MSRNALGRGLGDLLHRARPARVVDQAAAPEPVPVTPNLPGLPLDPPTPSLNSTPTTPPGTPAHHPTQAPHPTPTPATHPAPHPTQPPHPGRLPRFGPAYTPPPEPPEPSGRAYLYAVITADVLLVTFAAIVTFGPWIPRPLSLYLAAAAVLIGGTLACLAIAYQAAPSKPQPQPPSGNPKPSKVRVRLTRL